MESCSFSDIFTTTWGIIIILLFVSAIIFAFVYQYKIVYKGIKKHNKLPIHDFFWYSYKGSGLFNTESEKNCESEFYIKQLNSIDDKMQEILNFLNLVEKTHSVEEKNKLNDEFYLQNDRFYDSEKLVVLSFFNFEGIFKYRFRNLIRLIIFYDYRLKFLRENCFELVQDNREDKRLYNDLVGHNDVYYATKMKKHPISIYIKGNYGNNIRGNCEYLREIYDCLYFQKRYFEKLIKLANNKYSSIPTLFELVFPREYI